MQAEMERPAIPRQRDAGQSRNQKFINQRHLTPGAIEKAIKNWAIDKLAERFFEGKNTPEHWHAVRFWARSGRRLLNV
ncbi:MAG: hypothetical protein IIA63_03000 [Nitrospinae bacterium]|nr:hypothetical protein [Nitrospinota bacterium]